MNGYPRFFVPTLWSTLITLAITGVLLLPGALEMRFQWDMGLMLPDGWRVYTAMTHAFAAFMILVILGALAPMHMRLGWRRRANLTTGFALLALLLTLVLSSLAIYYLASETISRVSSVAHMMAACFGGAIIALHAMIGRRLARASRARLMPTHPGVGNEQVAHQRNDKRKQQTRVVREVGLHDRHNRATYDRHA